MSMDLENDGGQLADALAALAGLGAGPDGREPVSAQALLAVLSAAPRVLHVDADHDSALVLATLLVPETHLTHAATLAEGVRAIRGQRYALVVLDPDLPDGDGAALLAALRRERTDTPVLLYSARQPGHHHQANAFLPKPWTSPRQLWRTISELLDTSGARTAATLP